MLWEASRLGYGKLAMVTACFASAGARKDSYAVFKVFRSQRPEIDERGRARSALTTKFDLEEDARAVRPYREVGEFVAVDTGWYESAIVCYGFECFVDIRIWTGVRVFANFAVLKGDRFQVSGFRHRLSGIRHQVSDFRYPVPAN